jgi:hypothetical protein
MNYYETFIQVAPDCPVTAAVVPVAKGEKKSVPVLEYELLSARPYSLTQEQLLFEVYVRHKGIPPGEVKAHRKKLWNEFFSKPHACLRASSLPKKYGWGVHFNNEGKTAIFPMEGKKYQQLAKSKSVTQLLAMRSKRA